MPDLTLRQINEQKKYKVPVSLITMRDNWNYKDITRDATDKLKQSLMEDGQLAPIVVNAETHNIIGGHHQFVAIKELIAENRWPDTDLVWIEPREVKNAKHEKVLAGKANASYDAPTKERVAEFFADVIDSDLSLGDFEVVTDAGLLTPIEAIDFVSPSKEPEDTPEDNVVAPREPKEVTCPKCGEVFKV